MILRMLLRQISVGAWLVMGGGLILLLGLLLYLAQLVMRYAWLAGTVALIGLGLIALGFVLSALTRRRRGESPDEVPYL